MPSPARRWLDQAVTSWPNSITWPEVAGKMPLMRLNSVVLPAPFGPMIALRSPGMIFSDTPRTACRPPNVFDRLFSSSTGSAPLLADERVALRLTVSSLVGIPRPFPTSGEGSEVSKAYSQYLQGGKSRL